MSNYRVRQVLALTRKWPRRQERFLVALATYLKDDTLSTRVGFAELTETAGLSVRWMKITRAELAKAKHIDYWPGRHRGELTRWTVLCLPQKGAPMGDPIPDGKKGAPNGPGRGHLSPEKGGTLKSADQQEPEHGLNLPAKPSARASANGTREHREDPPPAADSIAQVRALLAASRKRP